MKYSIKKIRNGRREAGLFRRLSRLSFFALILTAVLIAAGCAVRRPSDVSDLMTEKGPGALQEAADHPEQGLFEGVETAEDSGAFTEFGITKMQTESSCIEEDSKSSESDEENVHSLPDEETESDSTETEEKEAHRIVAVTNLIKPGTKEAWEAARPKTVKIAAIGDMLMHPSVSGLAFQADGSIDYSFIFDPIRKDVQKADLAAVNNEVPMAGNQLGLQNYPNFNVFTELGDAEVAAGFNVILNATNHTMDQGLNGALNTLNFWKKYPEITILGLHETAEEKEKLHIVEVNGVRIAMLNYTYGSNGGVAWDRPYLLDLMVNGTREQIRSELQRAEAEADFTIVFPHWGTEYQLHEDASQQEWAQFFTENGADLIIGTHPHCLEPVREIIAANGNTALCYYSLGNYISMQDETISMLGGLAEITLISDSSGVRIRDHSMDYLVTHYEWDMNMAYVTRLENYTEELAARHGIRTHGFTGGDLNACYPFQLSTFYRVVDEISQ